MPAKQPKNARPATRTIFSRNIKVASSSLPDEGEKRRTRGVEPCRYFAQYLCQPLIDYLKASRGKGRGRRGSNYNSRNLDNWIDGRWEKYLIELKAEIEKTLQERSIEKEVEEEDDAERSSTNLDTQTATSSSTPHNSERLKTEGRSEDTHNAALSNSKHASAKERTQETPETLVDNQKSEERSQSNSTTDSFSLSASTTATETRSKALSPSHHHFHVGTGKFVGSLLAGDRSTSSSTSTIELESDSNIFMVGTSSMPVLLPSSKPGNRSHKTFQPSTQDSGVKRNHIAKECPGLLEPLDYRKRSKKSVISAVLARSSTVIKVSPPPSTNAFAQKKSKITSFPAPPCFIVPAFTCTVLSEKEASVTVMRKIFGRRIQGWFIRHEVFAKRIGWLLFACYFLTTIIGTTASVFVGNCLAPIQVFAHIWIPLYLSSQANWFMAIASVKRFDFFIIASQTILYGLAAMCLQIVTYQKTHTSASVSTEEGEETNNEDHLSFEARGDAMLNGSGAFVAVACLYWPTAIIAILSSLCFYDGLSRSMRGTLRYMYVATALVLLVWVITMQLRLVPFPPVWYTSYLDFYEGLITESSEGIDSNAQSLGQISALQKKFQRVHLLNFWVNRGLLLLVFLVKISINAFRHPQHFLFMVSRMQLVHATGDQSYFARTLV